jgi:hypothetical protein
MHRTNGSWQRPGRLPARVVVRATVVVAARGAPSHPPRVLAHLPEWIDEVVLLDGGPADAAREAARRLPAVPLVQARGTGAGAPLRGGYSVARGEVVLVPDPEGAPSSKDWAAFVWLLATDGDLEAPPVPSAT